MAAVGREVHVRSWTQSRFAFDDLAIEDQDILAAFIVPIDQRPLGTRFHLDDPYAHTISGLEIATPAARTDLKRRDTVDFESCKTDRLNHELLHATFT